MKRNLKAEMVRKKKTLEDLARATGRTVQTISVKINSHYDFSLPEAVAIKKELESDMDLEDLFAEEEE